MVHYYDYLLMIAYATYKTKSRSQLDYLSIKMVKQLAQQASGSGQCFDHHFKSPTISITILNI